MKMIIKINRKIIMDTDKVMEIGTDKTWIADMDTGMNTDMSTDKDKKIR